MTRTGVKLDLDVGELVANAGRARGAISALTDEMKKAEKENRWDDYAKLSFDRDRLQSRSSGFDRDIKNVANNPRFQTQTANGGTIFKMDAEYAGLIKAQIDTMKRLTADYEEAIRNGDMVKAREISPQLEKTQDEFHKIAEETSGPTAARSMQDAVKAIGAAQLVNAVTDGLSRWVSSMDRSGIVSKQGSGDVIGANIDETRRQANLIGGIGQSAGGILGAIIGTLIAPGVGTAIGGAIGAGAGKVASLPWEADANIAATNEAYARNWEQRAPSSMELAAVLGRNGGDVGENTRNLRAAFDVAARAASEFGYSAEEGIAAIKEAAAQGLSEAEAVAAARNVFNFERGTGADRGTLMSLESVTRRYGADDALGMGWAGRQAAGMSAGQYNEYLRAMQRIFEDGINKGFVRGTKEIVGDLTLVNQMAGGSELWKGEQGQQRLSQMNSALESTTALSSATDILAFRGAQNVLKNMTADDWRQLTDLDNDGQGDINRTGDYVDAMLLLERGLTPKLFSAQMNMINNAESGGRTGSIERMRQMYGLNYTNSSMIYDQWKTREQAGKPLTQREIEDIIKTYGKEPPDHDSTELDMFRNVEEIKRMMSTIGQFYTDEKQAEIYKALMETWQKAHGLGLDVGDAPVAPPVPPPADTSTLSPIEAARIRQQEYEEALGSGDSARIAQADSAMEAALNARDQEFRARDIFGSKAGKMYDEFFGSQEDKTAFRNVNSIFNSALESENIVDRDTAVQFSELLGSVDRSTVRDYNKNDAWNQLGNAGDIQGMLTILREILDATKENGRVSLTVE